MFIKHNLTMFVYMSYRYKMPVKNDIVFIEIENNSDNGDTFTTLNSFLALFVYRYLRCETIKLVLVNSDLSEVKGKIKINLDELETTEYEYLEDKNQTEIVALKDLRLPIYEKDSDTFICGMCAVCRELVRRSNRIELLGFKQGCLLAPAETSIWTRFCELDVLESIYVLLKKVQNSEEIEEVPIEVTRLEKHMEQPVRTHNIYKVAREQESKLGDKESAASITTKIMKEDLPLQHRFVEGVTFSIADLLLYTCIQIIFKICVNMESNFPLVQSWLREVDTFEPDCGRLLNKIWIAPNSIKISNYLRVLDCEACTLYKSDPKRYKPKNRIFTEQCKVDIALESLLSNFSTDDFNSENPNQFEDININWTTIEPDHEESSALPESRLLRKRQQLENMANAVSAIAKVGDRIVDFCSGTGHLGILLALKLTKCTIILVENKPHSLERAKKRANDLNLRNMLFYQCNIDYFFGRFELGTSLHACGTATDVVLHTCQRSLAKFVCCPCCYGSLTPMPHIEYPLSTRFRQVLDCQKFMYIAHAADQTDNFRDQGQLCMDIVDTDRKYFAEEMGYTVILTRLKPEQCTPKNRLLVGWFNQVEAS